MDSPSDRYGPSIEPTERNQLWEFDMVVDDAKYNEAQVQVLQKKVFELVDSNIRLETQAFLLRSELQRAIEQNGELEQQIAVCKDFLKAIPNPDQGSAPAEQPTPGL